MMLSICNVEEEFYECVGLSGWTAQVVNASLHRAGGRAGGRTDGRMDGLPDGVLELCHKRR